MTSLVAHAQTATPTAANGAAGDTLEEVIVTAERRSEDVQKVGLAISVINGAELQQRGDANIAQVLENVPGVTIQGLTASPVGGSGGPPLIGIRGVGTDGPNKNSATAVYEDGVLMVGGGASFYDISRVEVLRGPQGTLYGRGTTGGAVNIITNEPMPNYTGSAQLTIGSNALFGTQGTLNMPLSDDLAARFAFNTVKHDGFFNNGGSGAGETSARLKLLYKPNDDFSLLLGGVYYTADQSDQAQVTVTATDPQPHDWTTTEPAGGRDTISFREGYARLELNLGFANLTYIPSYQATHSDNYSYTGLGRMTSLMPVNNTFTQELHLSSPTDAPFSWIAGAYYFNNHFAESYLGAAPTSAGGVDGYAQVLFVNQAFANTTTAVFGEVTYPINTALRLTGGVRESRDSVFHSDAFSFQGPDVFSKTFNHFDWRLRLEHDLSADNLLYGMVSTGDRPGGGVNGQGYDPEVVTAYEFGSKNRVGDVLTLNAAAFYYDYGGFQSPQSCCFPALRTIVVSIPAAFYGAELEGVALLTPKDKLTVSANYLKAHFTSDNFGVDPASGAPLTTVTNGKVIPHSPTLSLSGSFAHMFSFTNGATITPGVDAHYQTKQFTDFNVTDYDVQPNTAYIQKAYTIANAMVTFAAASGKYRITVYDKNLSNVIYKTSVTSPGSGAYTAFVNDPRTFGVVASASF